MSFERASLLVAIVVFSGVAKGQSTAGAAQESSSRSKSKSAIKATLPDAGTIADGVYRNRFFGSHTNFLTDGSTARTGCRTTANPASPRFCSQPSSIHRKRARNPSTRLW